MNGILHKTPKVALFLATTEKAGRDKFQGILRYVRLHTPWNIHLVENRMGEQQLVDLHAWGVSGVIVARMPESIRFMARVGVPTVVMDSPALYAKCVPHTSFVTSDSEAVGRAGAEAFLRQGFSRFAYVGDAHEWDWSTLRCRAFKERLARAGFGCEEYGPLTERERRDWTLDQKRLVRWLQGLPRPTAILAAHDGRARQVLETCQLAELSVPGDIALLGVDNDEVLCENTTPTLSSIQPDFELAGYEAARLLEQLMRRTVRTPQTFSYGVKRVVVRESSRYAHAVDSRLLRGLEFIRLNACATISVPDIARHMGVSRRMAELLFRRHVEHSILEEIQQVRLARLKTFLLETDLPIGQISAQCGYQTEMHAKRVFKKATGMTMRRFRCGAPSAG
jgi:LacI family transcriptional regulator